MRLFRVELGDATMFPEITSVSATAFLCFLVARVRSRNMFWNRIRWLVERFLMRARAPRIAGKNMDETRPLLPVSFKSRSFSRKELLSSSYDGNCSCRFPPVPEPFVSRSMSPRNPRPTMICECSCRCRSTNLHLLVHSVFSPRFGILK